MARARRRAMTALRFGSGAVLLALAGGFGCAADAPEGVDDVGGVPAQDEATSADAPEVTDTDPSTAIGSTFEADAVLSTAKVGDLVRDDDVGVVVPAPGETVGIEVHEDDGTSRSLQLANALDHTVQVLAPNAIVDEATDAAEIEAARTVPCRDRAYSLEGFRWTSTYHWSFQTASTPQANDANRVEAALVRAANNIVSSRNSCGLADLVSATQVHDGKTTRKPNIASTATRVACGTRDNVNVIGFGALPKGLLGITCYWYDGNHVALEADVKLNARYYHWFTAPTVPAGCANKFSVESCATHELGHAFGLGHVSEARHGTLTMSTSMGACTAAPASLGLGDVRGLRARY
jgi:hypothetical protein